MSTARCVHNIVSVNVLYLLIRVGATYFGHIITHHLQLAPKAETISSLHQADVMRKLHVANVACFFIF